MLGVGVAGGTALAQLKHHTGLWTAALIFVLVLSIVAGLAVVIGGIGAFVTRPVPPDHAMTLRESAIDLAQSIEAGRPCNYGDGYRPDQAFCAHFKKLGKRLAAWDVTVAGPTTAEQSLDHYLDALMAEHNVVAAKEATDPIFELTAIRDYGRTIAMLHAEGRLPEKPDLEWRGFTNAGQSGPPFGALKLGESEADWISLAPLEDETVADWNARSEPYTERVDDVLAAAYVDALPHAKDVLTAQKRLEDFKRDELPTILGALQLVRMREAPRIRHGCESC